MRRSASDRIAKYGIYDIRRLLKWVTGCLILPVLLFLGLAAFVESGTSHDPLEPFYIASGVLALIGLIWLLKGTIRPSPPE